MGYADEIRVLKMKLNAMIEENAKLKGSQQVVQSMNEELRVSYRNANEKADIYKDAFDNIFFKNINPNEWDEYKEKWKEKNKYSQSDSEDKKRSSKDLANLEKELKEKALFLNKEISYSKIYIRDKMKEKIKEVEREKAKVEQENKDLLKKIEDYKANIPSIDEDSISQQAKVGRPAKSPNVSSNPLDTAVEEADKNLKEKEDSLKKSFFNTFLSKKQTPASPLTSNLSETKEDSKPIPPPKPVPKPSFNAKPNFNATNTNTNNNNNNTNKPKPSMNPQSEKVKSNKALNYIGKLGGMTNEEKAELASKVSKINSQFNLTEKHYQFIKAIAENGFYQMKDIVGTDNEAFSNAYKLKNSLVEAGFIQELEEINGGTGRSFKPILLSEMGNIAYVFVYKKNPFESSYLKLIREQKSPAHGLKIQQILDILIDAGYSCSQEDVKKTSSGRDTICDILARKQKTDFRIEYEEGNYNKEDYIDKFNRVWDVTPYLIVVVPNEEVKAKINSIVFDMVAKKFRGFDGMKKAGYQELVVTITQLKNNPALITNLIHQKR